jgi:hypothetical protein
LGFKSEPISKIDAPADPDRWSKEAARKLERAEAKLEALKASASNFDEVLVMFVTADRLVAVGDERVARNENFLWRTINENSTREYMATGEWVNGMKVFRECGDRRETTNLRWNPKA